MKNLIPGITICMLFVFSLSLKAQKTKNYYNSCAGQNIIYKDYKEMSVEDAAVLAAPTKIYSPHI